MGNCEKVMTCVGIVDSGNDSLYYITDMNESDGSMAEISQMTESELIGMMREKDSETTFKNLRISGSGRIELFGNGIDWHGVCSGGTLLLGICNHMSKAFRMRMNVSRISAWGDKDYTYYQYKSVPEIKFMGEHRGFCVTIQSLKDMGYRAENILSHTYVKMYLYHPMKSEQHTYFMETNSIADIDTICKRFERNVTEGRRASNRKNDIGSFLSNCIQYSQGTPDGIYSLMDVIEDKSDKFGYTPNQVLVYMNRKVDSSMEIFKAAYNQLAGKVPGEYDMESVDFMKNPRNYAFVKMFTKGFMQSSNKSKVMACEPGLMAYINKTFNKK